MGENRSTDLSWHWNLATRASQDLQRSETTLLDLLSTSCNAPSHGWNRLYRSFLALKHACTSLKWPPRRLKRLHRTFTAHTQAGKSFTAPTQGWKLLYRFVLALKHGCTSFTGLPMQWKRVYRTFSTLKQACTNVTIPSHGWKWLTIIILIER